MLMKSLTWSLLCAFTMAGCQPPPPTPTQKSAPSQGAAEPTAPTGSNDATPPASAPDAAAALPAPPAVEDLPADVLALVAPLATEQVRDGWILLFDGQSLFGWESNEPGVNWAVEDGTITADSGPQGLLLTTVPFADYELHCEFQMEAGGNSGVFLRTAFAPMDVAADCYELNIVDEHPSGFLTGSFVGRAEAAEPLTGSGDWKSFDVRCEGNTFTVDLDGRRVLDYVDGSAAPRASGRIGLQKNAGKIRFRNIGLRPLNQQSLLTGADLSGWRVVPGSAATFEPEGDAIRCRGGAGFLETEGTYGDFVLQLDAATRAADVNSGFFFRAEPGTEAAPSNGYEVQVDNSRHERDRARPANAGTGAIFRRSEARLVAADDHAWATVTLIAAGPRFATWVNGYPVVDWVDDRTADPNPRRGLRLEPGHISLQAHDPGTDVSFRRIRIAPLPTID
ncbi:MAG: DUF1080 domain-containing protein [Planctomyces sp.]|nr:DUF1080 domain-containing protein [Planctomyces sp.]